MQFRGIAQTYFPDYSAILVNPSSVGQFKTINVQLIGESGTILPQVFLFNGNTNDHLYEKAKYNTDNNQISLKQFTNADADIFDSNGNILSVKNGNNNFLFNSDGKLIIANNTTCFKFKGTK